MGSKGVRVIERGLYSRCNFFCPNRRLRNIYGLEVTIPKREIIRVSRPFVSDEGTKIDPISFCLS